MRLGGRLFTRVNMERRTVLHDQHMLRVIKRSGLDRVLPEEGEDASQFLLRAHSSILESGKTCELLGLFLLPVGKGERDWTPELAREVGQHIGQCDTPEDRALALQLAMEFCLGFFKQALDSLVTSLSCSTAVRGVDGAGGRATAAA